MKISHLISPLYFFTPCVCGVFLTGCSLQSQEGFDCPVGKGLGCQSITEVKKKLNQGEIDIPETTMEVAQRQGMGFHGGHLHEPLVMKQTPVYFKESAYPLSIMDGNGFVIQRIPEQPLRVWIAPYQDQDGNLWEASVVHTVIRQGSWQLSPDS